MTKKIVEIQKEEFRALEPMPIDNSYAVLVITPEIGIAWIRMTVEEVADILYGRP